MSRPFRLLGVAALTLTFASPCGAEGNRLLPFWGQPYPYGYAWRRAEAVPSRFEPCPASRRGAMHAVRRRDGSIRCEAVLHARD